ncbi:MAG: 16S rRNA (adenine(1518)-N(6)/adenine(1519)-N(6))-dimethyltransferase RsmA [Alphaproteobacteria bacterium]|nr:16S rRNA (adenine(1518)-N(6)/adenine(1519)-N(6))-dimethyltransferase RsmA [Alphaproteobacteria bacterium]
MPASQSDPILDLPPLKEVIATHGLSARKGLGQNFLLDLNLTRKIARQAGDSLATGTTVEIGPGPGGLTRALLLEGAARVVAIEKDTRAVVALESLVDAAQGRLEVIEADALKVDPLQLGPPPHRIVANLPYNVGTRLLLGWLETPEKWESFTLMFQREVADRLTADVGSKDYGRLSILTTWLTEARRVMDLPPAAFTPPPKVSSAVVRIVPRPGPLHPAPRKTLERVTEAAFGQRRKMLRQSLKGFGDAQAICAAAGVDPTARPETLPVEVFCALARTVAAFETA